MVLGDGCVQVQGGDPGDGARPAVGGVDPEDGTRKWRENRVRVGEHVDAGPAPGRIPVEAATARNRDIIVRRVAAGEGRDQNSILISLVAVPVNLPERLCV